MFMGVERFDSLIWIGTPNQILKLSAVVVASYIKHLSKIRIFRSISLIKLNTKSKGTVEMLEI